MKAEITNQYNTLIWFGECETEEKAWEAMFDLCRYPEDQRSIQTSKHQGLKFKELNE